MNRLQEESRAYLGRLGAVAAVGLAGAAGCLVLLRIGRRSGVGAADLDRPLPGDALVPRPQLLADRAAVLDAPAGRVWPWLVQLGKQRAGWYFPAIVERFLPAAWRGARQIDARFQSLAVGDTIPDYGPGDGSFKAMAVDPPYRLLYYSVREPSAGWTWPEPDDPVPAGAVAVSWCLVLDDVAPGRSRLTMRLRATMPGRRRLAAPVRLLGGLVDYVTVVLLFRGLKERLRTEGP